MTDDESKLKSAIEFMSLNEEVNRRKRDLHKAILSGDKEDIEHKKQIYEKVKGTRDSHVGRKD